MLTGESCAARYLSSVMSYKETGPGLIHKAHTMGETPRNGTQTVQWE